MTEPWYGDGLQFRCQTDCGRCCQGPQPGYTYLTQEEAERIAAHLGLTPDAFGQRYLRLVQGHLCLKEKPGNQDCVLWGDEAGCTVYRVRPQQCREFPFWPEVLESEETWEDYAQGCPGMNRGTWYDPETIARIAGGGRGTRSGAPRRLPTA